MSEMRSSLLTDPKLPIGTMSPPPRPPPPPPRPPCARSNAAPESAVIRIRASILVSPPIAAIAVLAASHPATATCHLRQQDGVEKFVRLRRILLLIRLQTCINLGECVGLQGVDLGVELRVLLEQRL